MLVNGLMRHVGGTCDELCPPFVLKPQVAKQVEYVGFYISSFTNNMKWGCYQFPCNSTTSTYVGFRFYGLGLGVYKAKTFVDFYCGCICWLQCCSCHSADMNLSPMPESWCAHDWLHAGILFSRAGSLLASQSHHSWQPGGMSLCSSRSMGMLGSILKLLRRKEWTFNG
jgi:hypothetical protein